MDITPETLSRDFEHLKMNGAHINRIKVTQKFADYLDQIYRPMCLYKSEPLPPGIVRKFIGIPVELDDAIENEYYELVCEEN